MKFWEAMRIIQEDGKKVYPDSQFWDSKNYLDDSTILQWLENGSAAHYYFDEWEIYNPKAISSEIGTIGGFRWYGETMEVPHD